MTRLLRMVAFESAVFLFSLSAWAGAIPDCISKGVPITVDNQAVIDMKTSTPNQYLARAHVSGVLNSIYKDQSGHNHFSVKIGSDSRDTIEVVYNFSFGKLPTLRVGMTIEACGDFINSFSPTSQYPVSPDGAIVHWVHKNPKPSGHESGYVVIDGVLFGQGN